MLSRLRQFQMDSEFHRGSQAALPAACGAGAGLAAKVAATRDCGATNRCHAARFPRVAVALDQQVLDAGHGRGEAAALLRREHGECRRERAGVGRVAAITVELIT